ncbi:hypothetical protein [Klenkia taihuensis]|uniref:Uncharacterized protein n=1 Tax=Klenkia taihuensis TaxID=1225127 RepID=A0A1I1UAD6_9ACTN|nr:hypothetical protein [Klenkia taihuensis]GHE06789.1 hypothetical protein GCM10011381_00070 [Klenkia taihuensis]SFD67729.1 hypothetical protein SAMN05661030_3988 [Klenkia taihuensis]
MTTPEAPRPGAWLRPAPAPAADDPAAGPATSDGSAADASPDDLAARLADLPVGQHADVLAAEHDRLHRLLATVDQL